MVDHDDTLPRKEPSQERSRALVDALVEATARILETQGPEEVTTNRVAEIAGASIGSLYQYFPNKESLLAAVIERELSHDMDLARTLLQQNAHRPLTELVQLLAEQLVDDTRSRLDLHHRMLPLIDDVHRAELVRRKREEMSAVFTALLQARKSELAPRLTEGIDAPEKLRCAAFIAMRAMELSLNAAKVEAPELLDRQEFGELLSRIFDAVMIQA